MKKLKKEDEQFITDKAKAREIIQVVLDYGVNQKQIYHMISLLAMELENVKHMKQITEILRETKSSNKTTGIITGE
tara:strand:- start:140 stop:367 length:228 start_codon:yes stop_codon:yes gene_type:complete